MAVVAETPGFSHVPHCPRCFVRMGSLQEARNGRGKFLSYYFTRIVAPDMQTPEGEEADSHSS